MVETTSPLPSWRNYRFALGGLILAAWLILLVWATTPYAVLLDHREIEDGAFSAFVRWPAFVAGWTLMVVAMMLPGSLPAVTSFMQAAATSDALAPRSLRWFVLGYLAVWFVFGISLYLGDTLLHEALETGLLPEAAEPLIPVVLLSIAGLYQFTPLKQSCRGRSRLPYAAVRTARVAVLDSGLRAGLLCIGTCGTTMLVLFALGGGMNLAWMAVLTAFTVIERTTRGARYASWALGLVLLTWAALKLARILP
jgi:predicted metal-binding membrane protein